MEGEFKIATLQGNPQAIVMGKEKLLEILQAVSTALKKKYWS